MHGNLEEIVRAWYEVDKSGTRVLVNSSDRRFRGKGKPPILKFNMHYTAGYISGAPSSYSWPADKWCRFGFRLITYDIDQLKRQTLVGPKAPLKASTLNNGGQVPLK